MSTRLFIGFRVSSDLYKQVEAWRMDFSRLPVRWIKAQNMHFTVVTPWTENNIKEASQKLDQVSGMFDPSYINLNQVEFGPNRKDPHLIWAKGQSNETIRKIFNEVYQALDFKLPQRKFELHLTIARFKASEYQKFPVKVIKSSIDWRAEISALCLYKVNPGPEGAEYEIVNEVLL